MYMYVYQVPFDMGKLTVKLKSPTHNFLLSYNKRRRIKSRGGFSMC